MKNHSVLARLVAISVLAFTTIVSLSTTSSASIGNITKADLAGKWNIALRGTTGCGAATMQIGVTLSTSGVVTRNPPLKSPAIPRRLSIALICGPPPWTTTGRRPA